MIKNRCPNCNIPVLPGKACPECSVENAIEKKQKYSCYVSVYGQRCNATHQLINIGTADHPKHWCEKHYSERRALTTPQEECLKRAKLFADNAKQQGISNYEFFKQYTGMDEPSDLVKQMSETKRIVAKHNPLYASVTR